LSSPLTVPRDGGATIAKVIGSFSASLQLRVSCDGFALGTLKV
jgi:hypothetical protein